MSAELLVIVPTRGRPHNAERLIEAFDETGAFDVAQLVFAIDGDDPKVDKYWRLTRPDVCPSNVMAFEFPDWQPMVPKLEKTARHFLGIDEHVHVHDYPYVAFMGDDHVPRTPGWARTYVAELKRMGTGIVYGDDLVQGEKLCTQWAMTTDIVRTLGRMVPAPVEHLYCDNAIMDLGRGAGCLKYLPQVVIEHAHPAAGRGAWDASYEKSNSREQYRRDFGKYEEWRIHSSPNDVEAVRALIFKQKIGTIGTVSKLTKDAVVDGRRPNGERCKSTTDELGNTVTESANRQDVQIRAPRLKLKAHTTEERSS